ncbi:MULTISPECIES: thiol-disulfide oxidoreductase DCC family protein [unclassified Halomonas]|uniref:thiol-disulfide oxidoreductase DCC family protein n=1 Tax=unclassified Halomonas TaxID=2609666 RepID=UPI003F9008FC
MPSKTSINIFYDAQCPLCRKERRRYERWLGHEADDIGWLDVSENEQALRDKGVEPAMALRSLHIETAQGELIEGIDAYRVLMRRISLLVPVAWVLGLPGIKPGVRALYDRWVKRRLQKQGRWPT